MIACFVCNKTFENYGRQKFCSLVCRTVWFSDKPLTKDLRKDNTMKKCECVKCVCKNCDCK